MVEKSQREPSKVIVSEGCTIATESIIKGEVSFGTRNVVHPAAEILALNGPIIFGDGNLVEEKVKIINKRSEPMIIGSHNTFEVGAVIEAVSVGDYNTFECLSNVGPKTVISSCCTIGSGCSIMSEETLPNNMTVYGSSCDRKINLERPKIPNPQIDFLSKVLVNYHYVHKPNKPKEPTPPTPASTDTPSMEEKASSPPAST